MTIREVASHAGVSKSAVSKVLTDAYGVSDELRRKVKAAMSELDYRPHTAARGMRGQTYTIGVLMPDIRNPFFADLLAGINLSIAKTQYSAMLGVSQLATSIEGGLIDSMLDRKVDGLIFLARSMYEKDIAQLATRIPMVIIGHHSPASTAFDTVNNDDEAGARMVVEHLVKTGRKRISMLSLHTPVPTERSVAAKREQGYRQAMTAWGLAGSIEIVRSEQKIKDKGAAVRELLSRPDRPDAIFCWSDLAAFAVIGVAKEMNLSVPGDLAVVGYDDTEACDYAQHSLTSVNQAGETLGKEAGRLLIERIKGRSQAQHFVLTPSLHIRGSSST